MSDLTPYRGNKDIAFALLSGNFISVTTQVAGKGVYIKEAQSVAATANRANTLETRPFGPGIGNPNEINFTQLGVNKNVLQYAEDMKNNN
jgi:hypothetical protein